MEAEVPTADATLHARSDGAPGEWVVLSHCLLTDHTMWESQIAALTRRYRVLRYDTRGHGRSTAGQAPYTMEQLADDIVACMDRFGIERAHLVGVSLGGETVAATALRHPGRAASVAVCDSRIALPPGAHEMMDQRIRLVREQGVEALVEPMVTRWFTPASLAAKSPRVDQVRAMIRGCAAEGFVGCTEALKGGGLLERLGQIACPALFLVGGADQAVPVQVMKDQAALVPGATYAEIPDAGHLSNLEQPERFNAALLDFLGKAAP